MERYHITLGASTTAGGKVTSAASDRTLNGARVAYAGDSVSCPKCNAEGVIEPDGPRISETLNGRQVALSDDICRCKCNPPPRLIANQTMLKQIIDGEWAAAKAGAAAETVAKLNTGGTSAATKSDGVPLVLLDPKTEEPYRNRRYKLSLKDKVIEGTTDQNGVTKPLTLAQRAAIVRWHVEDEITGA
ncbi:PAAR domain-containing protein [Massilia solisilvae]|uniref:PAAR domain-containing protein n=1 Tax=Massilia solisilvae TaxID=1811225 RepID=A0ABT2BDF8_9BURK|nr:PAAR domain-containing protein [Massilia solisilvae]MCS0606564.1 PAAR domain-containing protein [Massilia solisilvae]